MGDYGASIATTASTVGNAASTAGSTLGTASEAGSLSGQLASNAVNGGSMYESAMSNMAGGGEAGGNLIGAGGGYEVATQPSMLENLYAGSQGSLGDAVGWAKNGEWGKVSGYGLSKVGNTAMDMTKGSGNQGVAPVSINAQQPNPDNSYLQRLQRLRRGY